MAMVDQTPVTHVSPWATNVGPHHHGRQAYVMDQEQQQRLDNLMGVALLDPNVRDRLVNRRDTALLRAFGLSPATQRWLRSLEATTLTELAQVITAWQQPMYASA